jgi:hypothetical protein
VFSRRSSKTLNNDRQSFFCAEKPVDTTVSAESVSFGGKNLSRFAAVFNWLSSDGRGDASLCALLKRQRQDECELLRKIAEVA